MIRSRKKPEKPEGGPLLLATAILEKLVEDARRGDQAAAWAAMGYGELNREYRTFFEAVKKGRVGRDGVWGVESLAPMPQRPAGSATHTAAK